MITVEIHKSSEQYKGFVSKGHAGYAEDGDDIVCAAVSVLVINTINSIEAFTADQLEITQADGLIEVDFTTEVSKETDLLLNAMILGLQDIQNNYGNEYIKLKFKEV